MRRGLPTLLSGYKTAMHLLSLRNLLMVSPVFFLTIREWTNALVVILSIAAIWFLCRTAKPQPKLPSALGLPLTNTALIVFMLAGPLGAAMIGQLLRQQLDLPVFDAPLRYVLCIPLFLALRRGWLLSQGIMSITLFWLKTAFPLALVWTFLFTSIWPSYWGSGLTTYFVDPLTFGSYCLLFALLTILGLSLFWLEMRWYRRLFSLTAVVCGVYLSVASGSRTGWLGLPVFLVLWVFYILKPKIGGLRTLALTLAIFLMLAAVLAIKPHLANKFVLMAQEMWNYHWDAMNPDASVTMRISFYRMAWFYFLERPLSGWGDLGWMQLMNAPELMRYASAFTREFPRHGFHNEIVTQTVHSGVWGLVSSSALFGIVLYCAIYGIKWLSDSAWMVSFALLIFGCHLLLAGMSTEITNLVFLVSFTGLTATVMLGEQQWLWSQSLKPMASQ